jgi:hypothetical protein
MKVNKKLMKIKNSTPSIGEYTPGGFVTFIRAP